MRRTDVSVRVSPNSLATAVPFCVMAVVTCFDLVVGTQVGFMSLLSLGPALAPVSLGPVRTALTGGVAVVLSFLLAALGGRTNVRSIDVAASRLRISVFKASVIDANAIRSLGLRGVTVPSSDCVHVIIGPAASVTSAGLRRLIA